MKKTDTQKNIIFVLFGATGDLAVKKIFPALNSLFEENVLNHTSQIIAVSRRDWTDDDFRAFLKEKESNVSPELLSSISYSKIDIEKKGGYEELLKKIQNFRKKNDSLDVYIYLSLAPTLYPTAVTSLKDSKIISKGNGKIFIEKPFGTDEKTAKSLDKFLSFLDEKQICRIDHYLGKDTMLSVMDLHENTPDFDKLISKESVDSIHVRLFETKGIEGRGESYDHVGAFRDVGQNHMLEMLAVISASLPVKRKSSVDFWQKARAEVFTHLAPPLKTCDLSKRGQYEGYLLEKGVKLNSTTETAFEVETHLSSGKLKGTRLFLESGKKMSKSEAFIKVIFKDISGLPKTMCFSIQPEQEIVIENRDGTHDAFMIPKRRDAYANVIFAALNESRREFVGKEEIEALWRYTDHVVACWDKVSLKIYNDEKPFIAES